jgi:hypothetical protein
MLPFGGVGHVLLEKQAEADVLAFGSVYAALQ